NASGARRSGGSLEVAPAGGGKPPRRRRRRAGSTRGLGAPPLPTTDTSAASDTEQGAQTTESPPASRAGDAFTSPLAVQPVEEAATEIEAAAEGAEPAAAEAAAVEAVLDVPALDGEPSAPDAATEAQVAEVAGEVEVAEPAAAEAGAAEPVI